jgi:methionine--tRNA ligase beta chain
LFGAKEEPVVEEVAEEQPVIDIEPKEEITFEDFGKMQFQVGEIIACEAVPKSKKLLCSQVKIGSQVKQIVSGIKAHYSPEEMVGKRVMVLVNLKPAKLAGILSEGMILCAEDAGRGYRTENCFVRPFGLQMRKTRSKIRELFCTGQHLRCNIFEPQQPHMDVSERAGA